MRSRMWGHCLTGTCQTCNYSWEIVSSDERLADAKSLYILVLITLQHNLLLCSTFFGVQSSSPPRGAPWVMLNELPAVIWRYGIYTWPQFTHGLLRVHSCGRNRVVLFGTQFGYSALQTQLEIWKWDAIRRPPVESKRLPIQSCCSLKSWIPCGKS